METTDETTKTRKEDAEALYEPKYAVALSAGYLSISVTVWRLIWTGKLKSCRFSGRTLVG
jgi:hypothetical protein